MTASKAVSTTVTIAEARTQRSSLLAKMAAKYNVDADKMLDTLKATAFKGDKDKPVTNEQMMALLVVADQYNLNPWLKEIYAFPDTQRGGIVPVVGVDGWIRMINERPELVSLEFSYPEVAADELLPWVECIIVRKDRALPIRVREYMDECKRNTGPWTSHPRRMLRHKALIQCARIAFGFGGIYDPDEAERIRDAIDVTPTHAKPKTEAPKPKNGNTVYHEVPVAEIRAKLDAAGIAENDFLEQFGTQTVEGLALDKVTAALEWIARVHGG